MNIALMVVGLTLMVIGMTIFAVVLRVRKNAPHVCRPYTTAKGAGEYEVESNRMWRQYYKNLLR